VGTCATSDAIIVEVLALPTVDAGPDGAMCADGQVQLDATASSPNGTIDTYVWVGDASLSDPGVEDPSVAPAVTSEFTLTVTDAAGCQASDNTTVTVSPLPVVEAGPNVTVCDQPIAEVLGRFLVRFLVRLRTALGQALVLQIRLVFLNRRARASIGCSTPLPMLEVASILTRYWWTLWHQLWPMRGRMKPFA